MRPNNTFGRLEGAQKVKQLFLIFQEDIVDGLVFVGIGNKDLSIVRHEQCWVREAYLEYVESLILYVSARVSEQIH